MWGNPKREREIILASRKYISTTILHLAAKRITYKHNLSHNLLPRKLCHSPYSCTALLKSTPRKSCPQQVVVPSLLYGRPPTEIPQMLPRKPCPHLPQFCAQFVVVRPVQIRTVRPVLNNKKQQLLNRSSSLGNVPNLPWKPCQKSAAHFPLQALSQSLSIFFTCLAHYPRHSLII
jgi:hypothetical protein